MASLTQPPIGCSFVIDRAGDALIFDKQRILVIAINMTEEAEAPPQDQFENRILLFEDDRNGEGAETIEITSTFPLAVHALNVKGVTGFHDSIEVGEDIDGCESLGSVDTDRDDETDCQNDDEITTTRPPNKKENKNKTSPQASSSRKSSPSSSVQKSPKSQSFHNHSDDIDIEKEDDYEDESGSSYDGSFIDDDEVVEVIDEKEDEDEDHWSKRNVKSTKRKSSTSPSPLEVAKIAKSYVQSEAVETDEDESDAESSLQATPQPHQTIELTTVDPDETDEE